MKAAVRRRHARRGAQVFAAVALLLALLAALRLLPEPVVSPVQPDAATGSRAESAEPTSAQDHRADGTPLVRVEATPAGAPMRSFEEDVERLVAMGLATSAHATSGREAEARALDAETRAVFAAVLESHADTAERSLQALLGAGAPVEAGEALRSRILHLLLAAALQQRHARAAEDTAALVDAVLGGLRGDGPRAAALGKLLVKQPYLRAVHEPGVLAIVGDAGSGAVPRELAVELLLTLWHNLQAAGERAGPDLDSLAMLMLEDSHVVHRLAACRRLLANPRWRQLALDRARTDPALRRETAVAAAAELAPHEAVRVLADLHPAGGRELLGAFVTLGARDVPCLVDAYEQKLAEDTDPRLRASLLAGAGSLGQPEGIRLAEAAHRHDPDVLVREQALFVLTAHAAAAHGERVLQLALDDPQVLGDPSRLGALVLALENLARGGELHALERVGRRLRATALREADRARLEELLERNLPTGAGR